MSFDPDDLDWAMGELLHLFAHANRVGFYPHELNPGVFHSAWSVLNAQHFEVRLRCRDILVGMITRPLRHIAPASPAKRYANFWPR